MISDASDSEGVDAEEKLMILMGGGGEGPSSGMCEHLDYCARVTCYSLKLHPAALGVQV